MSANTGKNNYVSNVYHTVRKSHSKAPEGW